MKFQAARLYGFLVSLRTKLAQLDSVSGDRWPILRRVNLLHETNASSKERQSSDLILIMGEKERRSVRVPTVLVGSPSKTRVAGAASPIKGAIYTSDTSPSYPFFRPVYNGVDSCGRSSAPSKL